jgi:hypothetical protein
VSNFSRLYGSQSTAGDRAVGGILGFLFSSYSRPGDTLPVASTVFFDQVDFDFLKESGKVGMLFVNM